METTYENFDKLLDALQVADSLNDNLGRERLLETSIYEECFEAQWLSSRYPDNSSLIDKHLAKDSSQVQLLDIAVLLQNLLKRSIHKVAILRGITVYTQDQSTNFCISGSFSSEELKTVYESLREMNHCMNQK